jgi:hypothetical protein
MGLSDNQIILIIRLEAVGSTYCFFLFYQKELVKQAIVKK